MSARRARQHGEEWDGAARGTGEAHSAFLAMEPPTVTHNDLVPASRGGRPYIRKSDRLREAEAALESRLWSARPEEPMSGALRLRVRWCFATGGRHGQCEPHLSRPDVSNMLKTLEDCMVRAGWMVDDSTVCEEHLAKAWMDPAGIWVELSEV